MRWPPFLAAVCLLSWRWAIKWGSNTTLRNRQTDWVRNKLTVSLGSVLETERQRHGGVVLEELGDQVVPPDVVCVRTQQTHSTNQADCNFCSAITLNEIATT